jgi:hypothetical protein
MQPLIVRSGLCLKARPLATRYLALAEKAKKLEVRMSSRALWLRSLFDERILKMCGSAVKPVGALYPTFYPKAAQP